ncbi:MAG: hypothetical protein ACRC6O_12440, partial [Flavobacterium sp.]
KNLLLFLNSKYKSITSSKIVRELLFLLNNSVSQRSLMRNLGLKMGKPSAAYLELHYKNTLVNKVLGFEENME